MTTITKKGYIVKKDFLKSSQEKKLLRDLIVSPEIEGSSTFCQPEKFPVYRISDSRYRIPRFYGISEFGKPESVNLNCGVNINLDFKGNLKTETFQDIACSKTIECLLTKGGGILSLDTGFGKTTCALYILSQLKTKTLIIVHKEFLMNQWKERINQFLPDARVGILQQNKIQIDNKHIVIGMLQSISMKNYNIELFNSFGFIIIDEVHHICTKTFSKALFNYCPKYILGLSATPERKDGLTKVIKWFIGDITFSAHRENQKNVVVEPLYFNCDEYKNEPPLNSMGKLNNPEIINILAKIEERNELILNKIKECLDINRKIIVLSDRRIMCETLCDICNQRFTNKTAGLYLGGMKQQELKKNESCDVIFATYSLAHEGLDIPTLNTLILATPKTDIAQSVGRILREGGVKTHHPLIYDVVDIFATLSRQFTKRKTFYIKSGFEIIQVNPKNKIKSNKLQGFSFLEN